LIGQFIEKKSKPHHVHPLINSNSIILEKKISISSCAPVFSNSLRLVNKGQGRPTRYLVAQPLNKSHPIYTLKTSKICHWMSICRRCESPAIRSKVMSVCFKETTEEITKDYRRNIERRVTTSEHNKYYIDNLDSPMHFSIKFQWSCHCSKNVHVTQYVPYPNPPSIGSLLSLVVTI
jgi:hypothetical protein